MKRSNNNLGISNKPKERATKAINMLKLIQADMRSAGAMMHVIQLDKCLPTLEAWQLELKLKAKSPKKAAQKVIAP